MRKKNILKILEKCNEKFNNLSKNISGLILQPLSAELSGFIKTYPISIAFANADNLIYEELETLTNSLVES